MKITTDPNASINTVTDETTIGQAGLTKREYFAGLAMQALITNAPDGHLGNSLEGCPIAIQWADNLINELNK